LKLTVLIRQGLQAEGSLGHDAFQVQVLRSKDLTDVQKKYAHNYSVGDILIPNKTYRLGLEKNQQYRVVEVQPEQNRLQLQSADGTSLSVSPADFAEKNVYAIGAMDVRVGDRLCWTKNDRSKGIRNRQTFTVNQIDPSGKVQITNNDGKTLQITSTVISTLTMPWSAPPTAAKAKPPTEFSQR
jgi:hypothetical protein